MSHNDALRGLIRELKDEELDEVTSSSATPGYMIPGAFVGPKGKKPQKKGIDKKDHTPVKFGGNGGALKEDADADIARIEQQLKSAKEKLANATERTKGQTFTSAGGSGGFGGPHYSLKQKVRSLQQALERAREDKARESSAQRTTSESIVSENRYVTYKMAEGTPRQKIGRAIREINAQLSELDRVVRMNARLKTETNLQSGEMWKSTAKGLAKLEGKLVSIANRLRELKA
jgi:hypothetical protein